MKREFLTADRPEEIYEKAGKIMERIKGQL